jgi:hypothetical protein
MLRLTIGSFCTQVFVKAVRVWIGLLQDKITGNNNLLFAYSIMCTLHSFVGIQINPNINLALLRYFVFPRFLSFFRSYQTNILIPNTAFKHALMVCIHVFLWIMRFFCFNAQAVFWVPRFFWLLRWRIDLNFDVVFATCTFEKITLIARFLWLHTLLSLKEFV